MATIGRPRQFDKDEALQKAMVLFWQYGYESTSLAQLRQAMGGISSASFYAAFGSKEALFNEATALYLQNFGEQIRATLRDPELDTITAISMTLKNALREQTKENNPRGCMVVLTATNCSPDNEHIQLAMAEERKRTRLAFRDCIQKGIESATLSADTDADSLSLYFSTLLNGISIQARDHISLEELDKVVDLSLKKLTAK